MMEQEQQRLSPREKQIIELLAAGYDCSGIARKLFISYSTTKSTKHSAFAKLGVHTAAHAVAVAYRRGVLDIGGGEP